jgi:hemoglobin-like flavoprotein
MKALLVRGMWAAVLPQHAAVAELFYARLVELDPTLRAMFTRDMAHQGTMLLATLKGVVASLDRLEAVLPSAQRLAVRHIHFGVQAAHYDTVGQALLDTLEKAWVQASRRPCATPGGLPTRRWPAP